MADKILHRYDTKANWEKFNPILAKGEVGYEEDGEQYKVGDSLRPWKELPYRGLPCVDGFGDSKIYPVNQDTFTKEVKQLIRKRMILNVSQETDNYKFAGRETARLAVPAEHRGIAQILVYRTIERLVIEYCVATDINNDAVWKAESSWKAVGSSGALNVSEEKDNYAFATVAEARNAVQTSDRKCGQMICYCLKDNGWVYERFTGTDSSNWTDSSLWEYFITDKHLKVFTDKLAKAIEDFDTRATEVLTSVNTTVGNKINEMETFLSGKLSEFKTELAGKADDIMLTPDNRLQLMSGELAVGDPLELPGGILNLSKKGNAPFDTNTAARNAVKATDRILGQVITYKLADGTWTLDQFIGESTASWASEGSWVSYALARDLSPFVMELKSIREQVEGLAADVKAKVDGGYPEDNGDENHIDLVLTSNGAEAARIKIPRGGGSSGPAGVIMRLKTLGSTSIVAGENSDAIIRYNWTSVDYETGQDTGSGTVYITVNGIAVYSGEVRQGDNSFNLRDSLNPGANNVRVRITDGYTNVRSVSFNVRMASLMLTSTFADDIIYTSKPVAFRYTPVGTGEKKIRFWVNGTEIDSETTTASGKQLTKNLTGVISGANSIRVVAESNIEGAQLTSNELYFEFIYADSNITQPVITISMSNRNVDQFGLVNIPYLVYDPNNLEAAVELSIDSVQKQALTVPRARQYWDYQAYEQGEFIFSITCGAVSRSITLNVVPSEYDIAEEKGDLKYKASAIGKSNSGSDRASWDYGDYAAIFRGFLWAEDGWQKDDNGYNHLRLIGDAAVDIKINPFSNSVLQNGLTLTIEYATQNVADTDAEIIKCMLGGVGIVLTPTSVSLSSAQSGLSVNLDSSTKTSITFVVEKQAENRLVYLFVDGVMSGALQYPASDNFSQASPQPLSLSTGGKSCTAMIYGVRWYANNLNFDQVFANYIFDIEDFDDKIRKYKKNDVVDDYNSIDYNKALEFLPCLTIIGELPTYKGDKKTCDIVYEDRKRPLLSWSGNGIVNDVQGTSSQYYTRKNFKFQFKSGITMSETGEHADMYSMQGSQIPAKIFCMKADFAESSGTHNTGVANLVDEALRVLGYKVPPQKEDERVRTTVFGYPVLIFHKASPAAGTVFIGKYNFNDDKASNHVFGFTPGCECWEFLNNTSERTLFKSADFSGNDWLDDFEGRYPEKNTDGTNLAKMSQWIVSCKGKPAKFKQECPQHFNVDWLLFYCLVTEIFGMVDQRAKNMFLTTYGEKGSDGELIWYPIFYDNDTVFGINNEGLIQFSYNIESKDPFQDGHVWNGWDSGLWTLVESAYATELQALYQQMRQTGALSPERTFAMTEGHQADKWCEAIYNRDGFYKYIAPLVKPEPGVQPNGAYLYALQGSRTRHRRWWVTNRFNYMDSKYRAGNYMKDFATMRLYTPASWSGVQPNADFIITAAAAGYFHVKYGSYLTGSVRGFARGTYKLIAPNTQFNDTETIIYGISAIKSLGDLSPKYPGTVDITNALALEDLKIGSTVAGYRNQNLTVLHTGNNAMLRSVNVANCPNLKQSLDLSKCFSLKEVEARGSGITGLSLPSSGVLETLNLPACFTFLYLKNQPYMRTLALEGYANLNTVVVDNVANVDGYALCRTCLAIAGNKLGKVRITNIDAYDDSAKTIIALLSLSGEDDNGNPTDIAFVTGKLHVTNISQSTLDRVHQDMPHLSVTYDQILNIIEFGDDIVKNIAVANFDDNKDGEISANEVEFANWPETLLKGSKAVRFNELHHWKGAGSRVADVETLEQVSLLAGKTSIWNLPKIKRAEIYSNEILSDSPAFTYDSVTNCYSIEQFLLHGRYIETVGKGFILAKQSGSEGIYHRLVLPLRGYGTVNLSEPKMVATQEALKETTYPWGRDLQTLIVQNLYKWTMPVFTNLKNFRITGFSDLINANIFVLPYNVPLLDNLIIDDASGNSVQGIEINGGQIRNLDIQRLTCLGTLNSYFRLVNSNVQSQREPLMPVVDLPATYKPASIRFYVGEWGNWGAAKAGRVIANGGRLVIRSNDLIPCSEATNIATALAGVSVYVPDNLVAAYKAATNWSAVAGNFKPLSNL